MTSKRPRRRKVAILGGGMGSLAAAWELTRSADWQDRYEITVYQRGARLGGKGASSRDPSQNFRIEEHGLHVWFGCYEQAFGLLKQCYDELNRPASFPIRGISDGFRPLDSTPLMEPVDGRWLVWPVIYPRRQGSAGSGQEVSYWKSIQQLIAFAERSFDQWSAGLPGPLPNSPRRRVMTRWIDPGEVNPQHHLLKQSRVLAHSPNADPGRPRNGYLWLIDAYRTWRRHNALRWRLRRYRNWVDGMRARLPAPLSDDMRRTLICIDLAVTVARGFLTDWVIDLKNLDHLDDEDLRAWLARHGALKETIWSAPVRAIYDLFFAYENGDAGAGTPDHPGRPSLAAGTALESTLRFALGYPASVVYEMNAGMGEVVFAPIYEALKNRGVRFEFFHRTKRLELAPDGKSIARVHLGRQATVKGSTYDPLIQTPHGLPCWPKEPDYEQLEEGAGLRGCNLESRWCGRDDVEAVTLESGNEFDDVILGISLAALPEICSELVQRHRRWRKLIDHVKTVQTQSIQLWLTSDLQSLGWSPGPLPVNAAPEPLDVWADMSHLIPCEHWPADNSPRSLQYSCGPLPGDYAQRPASDKTVPEKARGQVQETAIAWLQSYTSTVWPKVRNPAGSTEFDWDLLHDVRMGKGRQRLDAQYLRANVDPSDRYVLSVPGSGTYRLKASESACKNLFLAGDWTRTDYNAGCIEAATLSGINAARALAGIEEEGGPSLVARLFRLLVVFVVRLVVLPLLRWLQPG